MEKYTLEVLTRSHNRGDFSCGILELDDYLKKVPYNIYLKNITKEYTLIYNYIVNSKKN